MRIQHNIMAMNAYRNYNTNAKALSGNLEKLSSGYKINRAGDDAAGLAISEKMRAQITGLDAAQKNVKDGISLVKTAEGAMQEIHDMLNRMDYLATQSANGTYDNEVDRKNLQKEVEALKSEINRIADSANFNGIKLLDGSASDGGQGSSVAGIDRILKNTLGADEDPVKFTGEKTILDGGDAGAKATKFDVDFTGLAASQSTGAGGTGGAGTKAKGEIAINYGGVTPTWADAETVTIASTGGTENLNITATAVDDGAGNISWNVAGAPTGYTATFDGDKLTLDADDVGEKSFAAADYGTITVTSSNAGLAAATITGTPTFTDGTNAAAGGGAGGGGAGAGTDSKITLKINGQTLGTEVTVTGNDKTAKDIADAVFTGLGTATGGKVEVTVNGAKWDVTNGNNGKLTFELKEAPTASNIKGNFDWDAIMTDNTGTFTGNHTAGTVVTQQGQVGAANAVANTVFEVKTDDIKDGAKITIDGKTVTLAVGADSKIDTSGEGVIDLTSLDPAKIQDADLNMALGKISEGFKDGTTNFIVGVNDQSNGDKGKGLTVHKKAASTETYDTREKLAGVFGIDIPGSGKAMILQIGDDAENYNQMRVDVKDMHISAMGVDGVDIGTQEGAQAAIDVIKNAINYVSDVRGDLGAIQNRLEHTGNNLSVMAENIQDAESTIRDTDVANEMMSYVKNNILVQSAQAMLAQANQVPQGVLQLLG